MRMSQRGLAESIAESIHYVESMGLRSQVWEAHDGSPLRQYVVNVRRDTLLMHGDPDAVEASLDAARVGQVVRCRSTIGLPEVQVWMKRADGDWEGRSYPYPEAELAGE